MTSFSDTASASHFDWPTALKHLPTTPGIYRMHNREGTIIYVGKAKNLRNRVRSYFQPGAHHTPRIAHMVAQVAWFDVLVTETEVDALILEGNVIKALKPQYNILMRDDKRYPWVALESGPFPRLYVTRQPNKKSGHRYFGPYVNSGQLYTMLGIIRRYFPLRQRRQPLFKHRPCMNFDLGLCLGPCQQRVTPEAYATMLDQVTLLLRGKTEELLPLLHAQMTQAAEDLQFERAARLRDCITAVQVVAGQQQQVMNPDPTLEADIVAMAEDARRFVAAVLQVRGGKLLERKAFDLPKTDGAQQHEALAAFVVQYYAALPDNDIPGQIVLPHPQSDGLLWQRWLAKRRGTPVSVLSCGLAQPLEALAGTDPAHWMQTVGRLAQKNAQEFLEQAQLAEANRARFDPMAALEELQEALDLPDFPRRMECYDISHVQGSHTVASMVVFTEGVPDKAAYRRFKIRCVDGKPDDFASMAEVIARRFAHLGHDGQTGEDGWDAPDLVIIDGGKGQLGAALGALRQAGLDDQPIISLAKRYEEVYLPGRTRPVLLPRHSRALFLLQQIRDEAHRFAITFHRSIRGKSATRSALDNVPGLGDVRKQKLLEKYPSLAAVAEAPPEEVAQFIRWSVVRVQQMQRLLKQGAEA